MKLSDIDRYVELTQVKIPHLREVIQNLTKEKTAHEEAVKKIAHNLSKGGEGTKLYTSSNGHNVVVAKDRVQVLFAEDFEQE